MSIYIVHFSDYDNDFSIGYFMNKEDAKACAEYYNETEPSVYFDNAYEVEEYDLDDTDCAILLKEIEEKKQRELEAIQEAEREAIKQKELAELARLKAKYE